MCMWKQKLSLSLARIGHRVPQTPTHYKMTRGQVAGPEISSGTSDQCLIFSPSTGRWQPASWAINVHIPLPASSGESTCAEHWVQGEHLASSPERRREEMCRKGRGHRPASPEDQFLRGKRKLDKLWSLRKRKTKQNKIKLPLLEYPKLFFYVN